MAYVKKNDTRIMPPERQLPKRLQNGGNSANSALMSEIEPVEDESRILTVPVPAEASGERLDRALTTLLADLANNAPVPSPDLISRSRLQALIADGRVSVDGIPEQSAKRKLRGTETITIQIPPARTSKVEAENIPLTVVFEDEYLLVIDKPAGLVVHPAPGSPDGTLVNALLAHCGDSLVGIGGEKRPGIVHRIDKDTSGLIVVAKTAQAHEHLSAQFRDHSLTRVYLALVRGHPQPSNGTLTGNIGRDPKNRKRMGVVGRGGKSATTHYRTLHRYRAGPVAIAALLECRLETGRTHQIRVHLSEAGHSLIGDPLYARPGRFGGKLPKDSAAKTALLAFNRQALHAAVLGFTHPVTGERLTFEADIPSDMNNLMKTLEEL